MKPRAFKFIFFTTIIILILVAVFILYVNNNEQIVSREKNKLDTIVSNNLSFGLAGYDSLNPHITQNQDVQYICKLIYKDLIGINNNFELQSSLAEEWSKLGPKTYLVKLKENEYWHNGQKFTSKDVEFTINELKSQTSNSIYKENVKNIEKVEIIDNYTIKIHTYEEEEFFEYNLCIPIVSYNSENKTIGTGKYKVQEITNKYIILEENNKKDISRKIKIKLYNSYSELYSAFSQEQVDLITTANVNFNNYVGTIDLKEEKIIGRELIYLKINTNQDINIRRAINSAINKEEIIYNVFNNKYYCADNPLNNGNYLGQATNESMYNLNNARKYVMNLGWEQKDGVWIKNGNILKINLSIKQNNEEHVKIGQELKKQLEDIGIKVNIVGLDDEVYNYNLENSNYEIILCDDVLPISPDIKEYLNIDNDEVQELLKQVAFVENKEILKSIYAKLLEQYKKESNVICLSFNSIVILHDSNVKGDFTGNWYNIFYNIDTWYKKL